MIKDVLNKLIKDSIVYRLDNRHIQRTITEYQYCKQYKNIGIMTHRQAGKTQAVIDFISSVDDFVVVIVPTQAALNNFVNNPSLRCHLNNIAVYTYDYVSQYASSISKEERKPKWVFFDECSMFNSEYDHDIITALNDPYNSLQTFVHIGTK